MALWGAGHYVTPALPGLRDFLKTVMFEHAEYFARVKRAFDGIEGWEAISYFQYRRHGSAARGSFSRKGMLITGDEPGTSKSARFEFLRSSFLAYSFTVKISSTPTFFDIKTLSSSEYRLEKSTYTIFLTEMN